MPYPPEQAVEFEFSCIHAPTCDVLADVHGRECEEVNQQAREDFYLDVVLTTPLGELRGPTDYPALTGGVVTEAHARVCRERGHATHTVARPDGVRVWTGICPRCGEAFS